MFTLLAVTAPAAAATPLSFEIVVTAESSRLPRLPVAVSWLIFTVEPGPQGGATFGVRLPLATASS